MWRRLPDPALALLSAVLIAAANPKYTRRLSFAAVVVFPGSLIAFLLGVIALWQPHPEHAFGLWAWSAVLLLIGIAIVAGAVRSTTRGIE
ncbi:MAG: hypothetical protein AB7L91_10620 [Dehalococcoidia bacterium]